MSPAASASDSDRPRAKRREVDLRRQIERQLLGPLRLLEAGGAIGDRLDRDAVALGQDPADPDVCGELILGDADDLAGQILRALDAAAGVHEDAGVTERARREDGDRDEPRLVRQQRDRVRRERHLRHVELAVAQHPVEGLLDRERQVDELDALGHDAAVAQRARSVVVEAGKAQAEAHRSEHADAVAHAFAGPPLCPGPDSLQQLV
jgi:hypothetical protein